MKLTRLRLVPESGRKDGLGWFETFSLRVTSIIVPTLTMCGIPEPSHGTEGPCGPTYHASTDTYWIGRTLNKSPDAPRLARRRESLQGQGRRSGTRARSLSVWSIPPDPIDTKSLRELFYIVNVSFEEHMADPDEKELLDRGEFVELLCRLALLRYADPAEPDGLELPRALDLLIENHVGPYVDHLAPVRH